MACKIQYLYTDVDVVFDSWVGALLFLAFVVFCKYSLVWVYSWKVHLKCSKSTWIFWQPSIIYRTIFKVLTGFERFWKVLQGSKRFRYIIYSPHCNLWKPFITFLNCSKPLKTKVQILFENNSLASKLFNTRIHTMRNQLVMTLLAKM